MSHTLVKVKLAEGDNREGYMRLSTSLTGNIMEVVVGGLINRFKIKKRRDMLFFEDILSYYIKECENNGFQKETMKMDRQWMNLYFKTLIPTIFNKLSPETLINKVIKPIWINLGLVDDIFIKKTDHILRIETKNEGVTRIIGESYAMRGFYEGILNVLYNSQMNHLNFSQNNDSCIYEYEINTEEFSINSKSKEEYDKLNYMPKIKGIDLQYALKTGVFQLKEKNKLYFRRKFLCPVENTIFHIIGNRNILLNEISEISYNYFKDLIRKKSSKGRKLIMLKTLLQTMGWGIANIILKNDSTIEVDIEYPPYGLQIEKDNWEFLSRTILGYFWLIDENYKIKDVSEEYQKLSATYSI